MTPSLQPFAAIHEALCDAFTLGSLERMVSLKLGRDLYDHAGKGEKPQVVFELVDKARRDGFLDDLVIAARQANPGNEKLAALPPTRGEELRYLRRLIEETEKLAQLYSPLRGIAAAGLKDKADFLPEALEDDPNLSPLVWEQRKHAIPERREVERYDDILDAYLKVNRVALLGAPGSGKSTTLRKLTVKLARDAEANPDAPLPVLAALGQWTDDKRLGRFLAQTAGFAIEGLSKAGRLVLLLDGLNEVPTALRGDKAREVRRLVEDTLRRGTKILVSCRREDYTGDLDLGLDTLTLESLSPKQVRAALRQWCNNHAEVAETIFWQLAGDARLAEVWRKWESAGASEEEFWTANDPEDHKEVYAKTTGPDDELWRRHVRDDPRNLVRLAANPFLLSMLVVVWRRKGALPRNRGDLFRQFIDSLLGREKLFRQDPETEEWRLEPEGKRLVDGLTDLAWRMQRDRTGAADFGVLTVVGRDVAVKALSGEELLKKALDSTLLEGDGELRFRHQLFQEYFTARALKARMESMEAAELWPRARWWERSGWEETAVLLAGLHSGDCTQVIRWLAEAQPEVAAQCVLESGAEIGDRPGLLRELQAAWLPRLTDTAREPEPEGRAAIGRALGRLDLDHRKGVGGDEKGVPDIDWVEIPGGEFVYQKGERRRLETFWMARYPVTNRQFQAFLDAEDGYRDDHWWAGLTDPERTPVSGSWTESNHPRETVSWWEAMAFCAWLEDKLKREVRLPTEWQWERAARGREGRVYPWCDEYRAGYANIDETDQGAGPHYLRRTSAVGLYPDGASAEAAALCSGPQENRLSTWFCKPQVSA